MTDHPITPPPELLADWLQQACKYSPRDRSPGMIGGFMAYQAARWGADQELEACCEWMDNHLFSSPSAQVRAARRPKPPSLKERALQAWAAVEAGTDDQTAMAVIRRALEQLDD